MLLLRIRALSGGGGGAAAAVAAAVFQQRLELSKIKQDLELGGEAGPA